MVRPIGVVAHSALLEQQWTPADEHDEHAFLHRVRRYRGPLPHGPRLWADVIVLLQALAICAKTGQRLRAVPGHEAPKGRGRPPRKRSRSR